MNRRRVFYLRIAVILLVMLSMLPVSVALNYEMENILGDKVGETDLTSRYNEIERMEREILLSFDLLASVLQISDSDLNPINEIPNSELEEDNFLQPEANGTDTGIEIVNSIVTVLKSNPENLSEMQEAMISLNENVAQLNSSVGYLDGMIEAANSTSGESYSTVPASEDISRSLEAMAEVLD